jgi:hypothetical protein
MKCLVLLLAASSGAASLAQPVITSGDLFNQAGQYYRAYANKYDPMDPTGGTAYAVPANLIGSAGTGQLWDFSKGPKDKIFRFDYIPPTGLAEATDFPNAKIVEKKTDETDNSNEWLFFEQVPEGRKVYGFYAENPLFTPSNVFVPPIVDFPDRITYDKQWNTSTTYQSDLSFNDPDPDGGGTFNIRQQVTTSSSFHVDAAGTMILPDELPGFGEGLRISEEVTIEVAVDFGDGSFDPVETDYTRNYYWVMPGYGIVAQLNSTQASSPPPPNFSRATAFIRMFETNKKLSTGGGGCTQPAAVSDLKIRVNNTGAVLLTWNKAECATQYRVDFTTGRSSPLSWTSLGQPTTNSFWQGENITLDPTRFYRVISLK